MVNLPALLLSFLLSHLVLQEQLKVATMVTGLNND